MADLASLIALGGTRRGDALRRRGDMEAEAALRSGDTWGRAIASLGDIPRQVQEFRQNQQQIEANNMKLAQAKAEQVYAQRVGEIEQQFGQKGPAALEDAFTQAGLMNEATRVRTTVLDQTKKLLEVEGLQATRDEKKVQMFKSMLPYVGSDEEQAEFLKMFDAGVEDPQTRGLMRQILGPTFDPERVKQAMDLGDSTASVLQRQRAAIDLAKSDIDLSTSISNFQQSAYQRAAELLADSTLPGQYEANYALLQKLDPGIAARFPATGGPESVDFATKAALTKQQELTMAGQQADRAATAADRATDNAREDARLGLDREREKRIATAPTGGGAGAGNLGVGAVDKIAGIDSSIQLISDLKAIKKDEWLGPLAGRLRTYQIGTPGVSVPSDLAEFDAKTATLENAVIRALTGAQMAEHESERIRRQIPLMTDKPSVWAEKAEATVKNLELIKRRTMELAGATPMTSERTAPVTPAAPRVNPFR